MTDTNKVEPVAWPIDKDVAERIAEKQFVSYEVVQLIAREILDASALAVLRAENESITNDALKFVEERDTFRAQLEQAQAERDAAADSCIAAILQLNDCEADAARMREALEMIAWSNDSKWQADAARAALETKK